MLIEYYPDSVERLEEMREADWQCLQQQPDWTPAESIARLRDRIAGLARDTSPGGQVQRRQFQANLDWILRTKVDP